MGIINRRIRGIGRGNRNRKLVIGNQIQDERSIRLKSSLFGILLVNGRTMYFEYNLTCQEEFS